MTSAAPWPCAATTCIRTLRAHELETGQRLCDPCIRDMARWLGSLPAELVVLGASMQRETTGEPARGRTRSAPLPCRIDTLNLLGPAAPGDVSDEYGDQYGDLPLAAVLSGWVQLVIEERHLNGPRQWDVLTLAAWLKPHLGWCAQWDWSAHLRDELHGMMRAVWGITRLRPRTRAISRPCPRCQELSLAQTDGDQYVRCGNLTCETSWTISELEDDAARRMGAAA